MPRNIRFACEIIPAFLFLSMLLPARSAAAPPRRQNARIGSGKKPLAPISSGAGVVICEPIAAPGLDEETAAFGAGCSRWLQFVIGGQPELGKTPLWNSLNRASRELGRADLRLKPADAPRLKTMLGATHAATGSISGNAEQCLLTYQLWQIDGQKPIRVGLPFTLSGSAAEVLQKLPALAVALSKLLSVASPHMPASVGADFREMAALGSLAGQNRSAIPTAQAQQAAELAKRLPLAGIIYLDVVQPAAGDTRTVSALVQSLLSQAPGNALVFGEIAARAPLALLLHANALEEAAQNFPQNFLLTEANSLRLRAARNNADSALAAEQAVRIAPANPEAWGTLGSIYSNMAERVRRSRMWGDMTAEEAATVTALYPKWLQSYRRAVQADPQYGVGWREAATAATFAGETQFADKAIWKAIHLAQGDIEVYGWGLEMYQPKWGGAPEKLAQVANAAAADAYPTPDRMSSMADKLFAYGFAAQANRLYARAAPLYAAQLARQPDDPNALRHLAVAFTRMGRMEEATQAYQLLTGLRPDDAGARAALAYTYYLRHRPDDSIREYREMLRLQPNSPGAHAYIGLNLESKGLFDQAEPEFRAALSLNPSFADAHYGMGDLYYARKQYEKAIAEYRETIRLSPQLVEPYENLSSALYEIKQFDSALEAAKIAVQLAPNAALAHTDLGAVYLALKDMTASAAECRAAIQLDPRSAIAHVNLGDALIELGQKAEAQAEWRLVLTLDHGDVAKEAREMLAKYP